MQLKQTQQISHAPRHARSSFESGAKKYDRSASRYTSRRRSGRVALTSRRWRQTSQSRGAHAAPASRGTTVGDKLRGLSIGKRIALGAALVFMLCILACVGLGTWFTLSLNAALAAGSEADASASEVLTPAAANEPFYILVMGSDSREGSTATKEGVEQGDNQLTDVMMLVRVDVGNKQLIMVSIPRDTPYTLDTGEKVKINELYNRGGAKLAIEGVSALTGASISHYAIVHFSELASIVDALGGVTVNVDTQLSYKDALTGEKVTIEPGKQTLTGQQAQIFARARHEYSEDQDAHRQNNVRQLAMAILNKAASKPLLELPSTVITLASCLGTDMRTADILSLAPLVLGGTDDLTIYSCSGPSDGALDEESGLWLCYENPEAWQAIMDAVEAGEDPSLVATE